MSDIVRVDIISVYGSDRGVLEEVRAMGVSALYEGGPVARVNLATEASSDVETIDLRGILTRLHLHQ